MIDWFTVVAQVVNFLILVALLRYFLYDRILAAMNERQQRVAARWDEARQQRDEAEKELRAARDKNRQIDDEREQLVAKVRDDVERDRQQLTARVRSEVDELHSRWSDAIREETESFLRDLRRRASEGVCAIARHALADLAGASLERQMVERFLQKVERLEDDERKAVIGSLQESHRAVVVQTSSELADDLRQAVRNTLQKQFLADLDIQFELSADLICGIALQTNAHKLAWDLRDHFVSLEQELQQMLEEETRVRSRASREVEQRNASI